MAKSDTVDANVSVRVTKGAAGYQFAYSGADAKTNGDLNFSVEPFNKKTVTVTFSIGAGSIPGIKFVKNGRDAMWIAPSARTAGSPKGPYSGDQFTGFTVDSSGTRLTVVDANDDSTPYRYALRFDLNGEIVQDDPEVNNGGSH